MMFKSAVAASFIGLLGITSLHGSNAEAPASPTAYGVEIWKKLVTENKCPHCTYLIPKGRGGKGGKITCEIANGVRHLKFPAGTFDIDEQVDVPSSTTIEGNANPNVNSENEPDHSIQTVFVATTGVTNLSTPYCGTGNNMKQGDAQKLRIGFLLNSQTTVKNIMFQGRDSIRPSDNGNLCGGGAFETPGCVSPGFGDGVGTDGRAKIDGCYDHTGAPNDLIIGDGKGVSNVTIESVRLNSWLPLPSDLTQGLASQLAVWVAMTNDGSATRNVKVTNLVSMLQRADGINFHGNVQASSVEGCHIENTGDDIYAFWGAYAQDPDGNVFKNNFGKNPGVTRGYEYGVCVAVYGAKGLTVTGTTCVDLLKADWNPDQVPSGDSACPNGAYCNSCFAYVHDGWFGAVYPDGNVITIENNSYLDLDGNTIPATDRPMVRVNAGSANIVPPIPTPAPPPPPAPAPPGTWQDLGEGCCHDVVDMPPSVKLSDGAQSDCKAKCATFSTIGYATTWGPGAWCTCLSSDAQCASLDAKDGDCGNTGVGAETYKYVLDTTPLFT